MKDTYVFIVIGLALAGLIQFIWLVFQWLRLRWYKSRKRIDVGIMYIRWNPLWKRWQCRYMDGYPAEEFRTLAEAIDHCKRGQLKKVY